MNEGESLEREIALQRLQTLIGQDLRPLAHQLQITMEIGQTFNKGWAGHTIERYLGLPLNSSHAPNFGAWELKVVPLKKVGNDTLIVKETMAITMIDPYEVVRSPFETSFLLATDLGAVN
jgi:DNA mismatch repair protein MutH